MLWLLTAVTTAALLLIAGFVREISRTPTVARPAALTATARSTRHTASSPSSAASSKVRQITDSSSGLSYRLLPSPWRRGCLGTLDTPVFSWTAGENAIAGHVSIGGTMIDWHGNACSGRLQEQFAYSGPADLEPVTMGVADAIEPAYYSGLVHDRTIEGSSAMQVSGHQAWMVSFLITYPDATARGWPGPARPPPW